MSTYPNRPINWVFYENWARTNSTSGSTCQLSPMHSGKSTYMQTASHGEVCSFRRWAAADCVFSVHACDSCLSTLNWRKRITSCVIDWPIDCLSVCLFVCLSQCVWLAPKETRVVLRLSTTELGEQSAIMASLTLKLQSHATHSALGMQRAWLSTISHSI